jgi:RNA polymerase sigma-70 factor, ECF subfamily
LGRDTVLRAQAESLSISEIPFGGEESADGSAAMPASVLSMNEAEFRRFYEKTAAQLRGYLRRVSEDPAAADDMLQESYLRLLSAPQAPTEEAHRRNYLFRIATNLLRDHFRAARRMAPQLPEMPSEAHAARDLECKHDLEPYLLQMKPRERELLHLAYVEGYRHEEIAEVLKCKRASVRPMLFRAREKLATLLRARGWKQGSSGEERS